MNKPLRTLAVAGLLAAGLGRARADAPRYVSYQGKLTDAANNPRNGGFTFTFSLFPQASGGSSAWSETKALPVGNGVFDVLLGSTTAFTAGLFDTPKWLEVTVGGEILTPRELLTPSPYALTVATGAIVDASVSAAADLAPAKINGGAFQVKDYNFPGHLGVGKLSPLNGKLTVSDINDQFIIEDVSGDVDQKAWVLKANGTDGKLEIITGDDAWAHWGQGMEFNRSGITVTSINLLSDKVGIGTTNPASRLHVRDGILTVDGNPGSGLQVGIAGAILTHYFSVIGPLTFPSIPAGQTASVTISVGGAAAGDAVALGPPVNFPAGLMLMGFVSAPDTVTVRCANLSGAAATPPAAASYRVSVFQH